MQREENLILGIVVWSWTIAFRGCVSVIIPLAVIAYVHVIFEHTCEGREDGHCCTVSPLLDEAGLRSKEDEEKSHYNKILKHLE